MTLSRKFAQHLNEGHGIKLSLSTATSCTVDRLRLGCSTENISECEGHSGEGHSLAQRLLVIDEAEEGWFTHQVRAPAGVHTGLALGRHGESESSERRPAGRRCGVHCPRYEPRVTHPHEHTSGPDSGHVSGGEWSLWTTKVLQQSIRED